jgi:hypothetical protein
MVCKPRVSNTNSEPSRGAEAPPLHRISYVCVTGASEMYGRVCDGDLLVTWSPELLRLHGSWRERSPLRMGIGMTRPCGLAWRLFWCYRERLLSCRFAASANVIPERAAAGQRCARDRQICMRVGDLA